MSYLDISNYYKNGITSTAVCSRLKKYYKSLGKKVPAASIINRVKRTGISDEELLTLRNSGMSFNQISKHFTSQNRPITSSSISVRLNDIPKKQNKHLAKLILNLVETRNATTEQIQKIADLYGVDLEETLNSLEER